MTKPHDHYGHRPTNHGVRDLPMFDAPPAFAQRWASLTDAERRQQRERWMEQLTPLVVRLAVTHGAEGITASEVISEGIVSGVLNGERSFLTEHPRIYSWIGAWLASLAKRGVLTPKVVKLPDGGTLHITRKSARHGSHGNSNGVYLRGEAA